LASLALPPAQPDAVAFAFGAGLHQLGDLENQQFLVRWRD